VDGARHGRLTVATLGVAEMRDSIRFYEALGFERKLRQTGDEVAFFAAGGAVLALYPRVRLAADADLPGHPPNGFGGVTLAWNCNAAEDVDAVLAHALTCGARLLKPAHRTSYGGYCGYFADPDGHVWEVVQAPGLTVSADGRLILPD
jgi:uncharacterized glyoxalase superfamily protein PhnB